MTSTTIELRVSTLLAGMRDDRSESNAAELRLFLGAIEWCHVHEVSDELEAATWRETWQTLGGDGTPMVAEFCVAEFGANLGMSPDSGRSYLAHALEIAHRLPRLFDRVAAGDLPVWRARRIAEHTICLSPQAAAYVDQQIAAFAHKIGPAATERLVDEAVLRFMPDEAAERAAQAADNRRVRIVHDHSAGSGTSSIFGNLDLADALDLEGALRDGAAAIKVAGSEDSLDVRRSIALGDLARGQSLLPLSDSDSPVPVPVRRDVTLYLHLSPDSPIATLDNAGGHLITKDQLSRWFDTADTKMIIKPVLDLNEPIATSAYAIPEKIREHVILRDRTCIFPGCTRPSRQCDLDHIEPYDTLGPPDQTRTGNLAPLCRYHHRCKTFGRWSYTMLEPGVYLWRSPHGRSYLRDREGTQDLTPRPVEPPG